MDACLERTRKTIRDSVNGCRSGTRARNSICDGGQVIERVTVA